MIVGITNSVIKVIFISLTLIVIRKIENFLICNVLVVYIYTFREKFFSIQRNVSHRFLK